MSKHTPGPWEAICWYPENEPPAWRIQTLDGAEIGFASTDGRGCKVDEESEANARLFAAAPDLLEALKLALFLAEAKAKAPLQVGDANWPELAKEWRAAIAKAEGRDATTTDSTTPLEEQSL